MDEIGKITNFYISYNKMKEEVLSKTNLRLKYDYCNLDVLEKVQDVALLIMPNFDKAREIKTELSFIDYLSSIICEMDSEKILEFFEKTLEISNINHKRIGMNECTSRIIAKNNRIKFDITLPIRKRNTDLLSVATIHELSHYSLYLNRDKMDIYEYTEVLPIFFEYMMYSIIYKNEGKEKFINNRLRMIGNNIDDLEIDLMYATNPHYLNISPENYEFSIASALTYIESFEYVLQLIENRENNKKEVDETIGKMLMGEQTLEETTKKLDINVDNYNHIYKLIK
jgi:hypothetical protein